VIHGMFRLALAEEVRAPDEGDSNRNSRPGSVGDGLTCSYEGIYKWTCVPEALK